MALELGNKKFNSYKGLDGQDFERKMGNFLLRKGFSYSTVLKVLQQYKVRTNKWFAIGHLDNLNDE